ncbi:LysR family transcriptional regulator [Craterilacuibacter sp. RT1T]|uniref:LysR family transcriptional regulator n=1 Tax=Craterilacuibacter sp. RT1T TaxID=2942211 RepID=UPI0020BF864C|nr:LysR family transcriptional regulator [Craterilacuibacter sp. RT1T]MCL6262091.1 LysR substrate-binding domain-containing protein [Craterilacuibacter sp. RT1T]
MDIRALRYFAAVVREQSFTRAADSLFVTQPTISKMVRQLEDELGTPLLLRQGKHISLTDAGKVTLARAEDMLHSMQLLKRELIDLSELKSGELVFGLPPMVGAAYFAPVVSRFREHYPKIELKLVETGALAVESQIRSGEVELGIAVLPVNTEDFSALEVVNEPLCLVAPANSAWHGRESVFLAELTEQTFVLYPPDFTLTAHIAEAFRRMEKPLNIAGSSAQWDFLAELVGARLGITLLPYSVAQRLNPAKFDLIALADADLRWHLALIWRNGAYLSHAARAWIDTTRSVLAPTKDAS